MGEAACVVIEAAHPDACLLLDAFHIYRSGSSFTGLKLLNWGAMHLFHLNDYPADPPRERPLGPAGPAISAAGGGWAPAADFGFIALRRAASSFSSMAPSYMCGRARAAICG